MASGAGGQGPQDAPGHLPVLLSRHEDYGAGDETWHRHLLWCMGNFHGECFYAV